MPHVSHGFVSSTSHDRWYSDTVTSNSSTKKCSNRKPLWQKPPDNQPACCPKSCISHRYRFKEVIEDASKTGRLSRHRTLFPPHRVYRFRYLRRSMLQVAFRSLLPTLTLVVCGAADQLTKDSVLESISIYMSSRYHLSSLLTARLRSYRSHSSAWNRQIPSISRSILGGMTWLVIVQRSQSSASSLPHSWLTVVRSSSLMFREMISPRFLTSCLLYPSSPLPPSATSIQTTSFWNVPSTWLRPHCRNEGSNTSYENSQLEVIGAMTLSMWSPALHTCRSISKLEDPFVSHATIWLYNNQYSVVASASLVQDISNKVADYMCLTRTEVEELPKRECIATFLCKFVDRYPQNIHVMTITSWKVSDGG